MNPVLTPQLLLAVGVAGAVAALVLLVVRQAMRTPGRPRDHKPEHRGATEDWSPKQWAPPPRPLDAHLDVYEQERIEEANVVAAVERLEVARANRLRFEMEQDARRLRDVETTIIKKIRYAGYDPKELTQEINREEWLASVGDRR